jgi:hypothetical protein
MIKFIKIIVVVAVIVLAGLFAYDYYMTNSGVENRVEYEIQKHNVRNSDHNPLQETGKEKRQRRRGERREKVKEFFNN